MSPKEEDPPAPSRWSVATASIHRHDWLAYYDEPLSFSWSRPMGDAASDVLLATGDLADRADFTLGQAEIFPSTRIIRGPGGEVQVEPRVMQVLVTLADHKGRVLSRDAIFRRCWGNVVVGEDSLNRVIAEVRRIARTVAAGSFAIETIPRTGYRLICAEQGPAEQSPAPRSAARTAPPSLLRTRRLLLGAGVGGAVMAGAGLVWWLGRPDPNQARVAALIAQSEQAARSGLPNSDAQGVGFLQEAVALAPENEEAWGKLALAKAVVAEHAPPGETAEAVAGVQDAARRALALDPRQADALAALAILPPYFGDWFAAERRMKSVLAVDPGHLPTRDALAFMYAAVGRGREGSQDRLKTAALEPLHVVHQFKLIYAHWILGQIGEADRAADRALQLWPKHPAVWFARLYTYAFTGRADRALAQVDDASARPDLPPPMIATTQAALVAMLSGRAIDREQAVAGLIKTVSRSPSNAIGAVLWLNALGEIDSAFQVTDAYLLERGPLMASVRWRVGQVSINDQRRRKTNMLFVPVSAPMRTDPRFMRLANGIGLADYWSRSGLVPDFLR